VTLADAHRMRLGMVSNGTCVLKFNSHQDALTAARVLAAVEVQAGLQLDVAWADAKEWRAAAPRLPAYF
jgi:hypothetical protein